MSNDVPKVDVFKFQNMNFVVCPQCKRTVELGLMTQSTPDAKGALQCHWCGTKIRITPSPKDQDA